MRALMDYAWPGNVRELQNILARAVILSKGPRLVPEDLPDKLRGPARPAGPAPAGGLGELPPEGLTLKDMETELIINTLKQSQGNKTQAARMLGISRKGLYEKMQRLGIKGGWD